MIENIQRILDTENEKYVWLNLINKKYKQFVFCSKDEIVEIINTERGIKVGIITHGILREKVFSRAEILEALKRNGDAQE